ncbi:hypothetical protein F5146DRAFT_1034465 [Armillaria mellea]|nr:hypothetical protein F5146DRAFT_1034465 [Armillaria mellea]
MMVAASGRSFLLPATVSTPFPRTSHSFSSLCFDFCDRLGTTLLLYSFHPHFSSVRELYHLGNTEGILERTFRVTDHANTMPWHCSVSERVPVSSRLGWCNVDVRISTDVPL